MILIILIEEEIARLFSELIGKEVDETFRLFPSFYTDFGKNISVGKNVWIGSRLTILSGVKINDGAIVAAGSIVNKDYQVILWSLEYQRRLSNT